MPGVEAQAVSHARTSRSRGRPDGGGRVWLIEHRAQLSGSVAVAAIAVGAALHALGLGQTGDTVWGAAVAVLAAELTVEVGRTVVVEPILASTRLRSSPWSARWCSVRSSRARSLV
jgi:hypothetical protein